MKFVLGVVALAMAVGCGGGKVDSYDGLIAKMHTFKDEMCKCTDEACAKAAYDRMGKWAAEHIETITNAKPTPPQREAMKKVEDELKACQAAAGGS